MQVVQSKCNTNKIRGDECVEGQEAIVWCLFGILVVVVFVTIDMTKNFNEQRSETIGCEEAKKAKANMYCTLIGCTKVLSIEMLDRQP